MPGYRWTQPEIDYLHDLVGDYPLQWIVKDFNRWAAKHNRPRRTRVAIQKQIWKQWNASSTPDLGEWLSTPNVARLVGRTEEGVWLWIKKGWIQRDHTRQDHHGYYICRRGLRQLARDYPAVLKHLNADQLFNVLEDQEVVDHVLRSDAKPKRLAVAVQCLETGEQFPTMRAAAERISVHPNSIRMAIKRNGTAKGYHFQEAA